jgi:hypothetical protein
MGILSITQYTNYAPCLHHRWGPGKYLGPGKQSLWLMKKSGLQNWDNPAKDTRNLDFRTGIILQKMQEIWTSELG